MTKTIVEKAKVILDGIEIGEFTTAKDWSEENYADYYQYFPHPDVEVRKYSLLVFAAALGNWQMKSAFIFLPIEKLKEDPDFYKYQDKIYFFEDYLQAFLENRKTIEQEFPLLYRTIIDYLVYLNNEKPLEDRFPSVDKQLFIELSQLFKNSNIDTQDRYTFNDLLREVGLPTFFED